MTSQQLLDQTIRHSVHLEQFKANEVGEFKSYLKRIDAEARKYLLGDNLTTYSRAKLEKLLKQVDISLKGVLEDYYSLLSGNLGELGLYEAGFEAKSLGAVLAASSINTLKPSTIIKAIKEASLSVRGSNEGKLLEPFIRDWTKSERDQVIGVIRQGYVEGLTNQQIQQRIRGTRANKYLDGILATTARHAEAVVRTAVQHVAITAKLTTWAANDDIISGFMWLSTLDGATSSQCRSLDGQEFALNKGPRPPLHVRCRSQVLPILKANLDFIGGGTRASKGPSGVGQVKADLSYYEWLKRQPKTFQDDTIGKARATLLRDGGLTAERFAELNLNRNFKPLTLSEMRQKEPEAFKLAFGE